MESPIRVLGLDHVVLRVRDLDAALRFYVGCLGCHEERRLDAVGLVQLRAGSALIDLVPVESPLGRLGGGPVQQNARNVDHFALRLERFSGSALRAHLAEHGVTIAESGIRYGADGNGPSIYVCDPDGNSVELKGPPGESMPD